MGKIDAKLVSAAEQKLSQIFLELGTKYDNTFVGTCMGGDPLIFSLMYPVEHICTLSISTAATDGRRFYWNPKFVLKQSKIGLRIICSHEAWHAIYMHPQRRGSRLPKLWNIAVDYIVNGTCMEDLKARQLDPVATFTKELGKFLTLEQYADLLRDPFKSGQDLESKDSGSQVKLPSPDEDRELTDEEMKELERQEKKEKFFFADPDLSDDMKRPEAIYDYLYSLLPKCPKCGSVGVYKKPNQSNSDKDKDQGKGKNKGKGKKGQGKGNGSNDNHDHGNGCGDQCQDGHGDQCQDGQGGQGQGGQGQGCDNCGDGVDVFDLGGTVDDHMDTSESEEKLAKRIADAMYAAKKMAGTIPAGLEEELGKLTAPKVTWQDIIRTRLLKARSGNGRNDWTRFRSRPMFSGLLVPKRKNYYAHFGCLLDTSGSMSADDMAFGLSQLVALDERSEGTIVPADAEIYWDQATKIKKAVVEEITKVKVVGRGGTQYAQFFSDYEEKIGKCDFLIVITDGFLLESDLVEMKHPGVDVIWLITSGTAFKAPFGRVFDLIHQ